MLIPHSPFPLAILKYPRSPHILPQYPTHHQSTTAPADMYYHQHNMNFAVLVLVGVIIIQCMSSMNSSRTQMMFVESFQPTTGRLSLVRTSPFYMVRRGKGSIGKEVSSSSEGGGGMGMEGELSSSSTGASTINWTPIAVSVKALPTEENKVTLIDTNLVTMKNSQTNPTGAVSVIQYKKQMYCFAVNCPSCQIPLLKATCVPGNEDTKQQPLLQCDLCKATYNIQTGDKISGTAVGEKPGILGGIVKSLFASKASGPLKVYKLAEKNGKLLIAGLD